MTRLWILFLVLFGLEGVLAAQTMVEGALGAGAAATGASSTRNVGNAVGNVVRNLDNVLTPARTASGTASRKASRTTSTPSGNSEAAVPEAPEAPEAPRATLAEPVRQYEDPAGIRAGMTAGEVIRRFGPPLLDVVGADIGRQLTYSAKSGTYQLDVKGETVSRISVMSRRQTAMLLPSQGFQSR